MTLTVNSSNPNKDLTRISRVKEELQINSNKDDSLFAELIMEASDRIRSFTGRDFAEETITETMASRGRYKLLVERTPLKSILFIEEDGALLSSTSYEIDDKNSGIIFREDNFDQSVIFERNITLRPTHHGRKIFKIKYNGGWKMPGQVDRDLPHDLERACVDLVKDVYLNRHSESNLVSESISDASRRLEISESEDGLPRRIKGILRKYQRVEI